MEPDPTTPFSSRVEDYVRYRPSYPTEVISRPAVECGILSRLFLDFGCTVFGVAPNANMRGRQRHLAGETRFHCADGRGEDRTLPGESVE